MAKEGADWGGLIVAGIGIGGGLLVLNAVGAFKPRYQKGDILFITSTADPNGWWLTVMDVNSESYHLAEGQYPNLIQDLGWTAKNTFNEMAKVGEWKIAVWGHATVP